MICMVSKGGTQVGVWTRRRAADPRDDDLVHKFTTSFPRDGTGVDYITYANKIPCSLDFPPKMLPNVSYTRRNAWV